MADFINTIAALGEDAVIDSIIDRTITEFKDDTLTDIGRYAFNGCLALENVEFPDVSTVYDYAFSNCAALISVSFPKLKSTVGVGHFNGCKALKMADMPNLEVVGSNMFYQCSSLSSLEMSKITALGANGLSFTAIDAVKAPLVKELGSDALRMMFDLRIADLPVCTKIHDRAFYASGSLATLILRSETMCTLTSTGAFAGTYDGNKPQIARGAGYIYVPRALLSDDDATKDYRRATNWSALYDSHPNLFRALEDYTVDGTTTGELDESKI